MRKFLLPLAILATATTLLATSGEARADEGQLHEGLELGLRLGYGIPLGDSAKDSKLSDFTSGKIPIQLDVGYRVMPELYVGLYGEYAIGLLSSKVKDSCDKSGGSCSSSDIRLGVNVHYHLATAGSVLPWIGAGIGYEIASSKSPSVIGDITSSVKGLEFINLQGGADFPVASGLRVGPFVNFSVAQYSTTSASIGGSETSGSIDDKGIHEWLTLGIRGAFNL